MSLRKLNPPICPKEAISSTLPSLFTIAMTLLYYFETSLDYHGMTSKELYKLWLKHAKSAFKLYDQGIMKYAFKVGQSDI